MYHSWIYERILNTEWFMRTLVYFVIGVNVLSPAIAWYFVGGKQAIAKAIRSGNRQPSDE